MKRPRVLLADDHRLLREALSQLLERGCDVVGAAADGRALLTAAAELRPDIVVLDSALPLLNGWTPPAGSGACCPGQGDFPDYA